MKKISILLASLALAVGFTACDETQDDNPVLLTHEGQPVRNFLNTPTMQNMYIMLSEEAASDNLHLTCSQPTDYGFATRVCYYVQVALDRNFTLFSEVTNPFTECAQINPTNDGVAAAICDIIQTEKRAAIGDPNYELTKDDVLAYYNNTYKPIYVRLRSQVTGIPDVPVEGTDYLSNVVEYKNVAVSYMALSIPDKNAEFYLRGTMNNWGNGEGDFNGWEFYTTKVKGTYITNVVTMPKGTEFKIADATWGAINLGGPASVGVDEKDAITIGTPDGNNMTLGQDFEGVVLLTSGSSWKMRLVSTGEIKNIQNINGMLGPQLKEELAPWL